MSSNHPSLSRFKSTGASAYGLDNIVSTKPSSASSSGDPFDTLLSTRPSSSSSVGAEVSLLDYWSTSSKTATPAAAPPPASRKPLAPAVAAEQRKAVSTGWDPHSTDRSFQPLLNDVLKADLGPAKQRNSNASSSGPSKGAPDQDLQSKMTTLAAEKDALQAKLNEAESKIRKINALKKKSDAEVNRLGQEVERLNSRLIRSSYDVSTNMGVSPMKSSNDDDQLKKVSESAFFGTILNCFLNLGKRTEATI
jgi:hypothetical protein